MQQAKMEGGMAKDGDSLKAASGLRRHSLEQEGNGQMAASTLGRWAHLQRPLVQRLVHARSEGRRFLATQAPKFPWTRRMMRMLRDELLEAGSRGGRQL